MSRHAILDPAHSHEPFHVQQEAVRQLIEHISEFPGSAPAEDSDDFYLVNYVTALLGQRGAGKTTVILELRKKLRQMIDEKGWLCTEVLVPDVLHSRDAIGPAIFDVIKRAFLSAAADDDASAEFVRSRLDPMQENLAWFHNPLVPDDIIARDSVSAASFARAVFTYHIEAKGLHTQFSKAIDSCVQHLNMNKVIVLIDDADINITLVGRVLDVVRYALSSPRIVTVFSCDFATLRRRLFNERLKTLNIEKLPDEGFTLFGSSGQAFKAREIEAEREYVDAFLAKLLPPSTRVTLHPVAAEELVWHPIRFEGDTEGMTTIGGLVNTIQLEEANAGTSVELSSLIEKYPNVLQTNLRGFVNQASQISVILKNYCDRNYAFFDLLSEEGDKKNLLVGGPAELSGAISPLDEAALVRLLRVFLLSADHVDWLEGLAYFGILDVPNEPSLAKILNTVISRVTATGSAIDVLTFRVSGADDEKIHMTKKAQVHVIHLIIDLAIVFGGNLEEILRHLGLVHSEAFRYFYLSQSMYDYASEHAGEISHALSIISGSEKTHIAGLASGSSTDQSTAPIFVLNSRDMAIHVHRSMHGRTFDRGKNANNALWEILKDEDVDQGTKLTAQTNQFYKILYFMMDLCVDQVRSAFSTVFDYPPTDTGLTELSFTTNTQVNWGIVNSLNGWTLLRQLLSKPEIDGAARWDKGLMVLFHLVQMPYEPMFACFRTSGSARQDRAEARRLACELHDFLLDHGLVKSGESLIDVDFRARVRASEDLPHLGKALTHWPSVNMWERGTALLNFLDFVKKDGIDLPEDANLASAPPPIWKSWVDRFVEIEAARADSSHDAIRSSEISNNASAQRRQ